jgi:hypothetical protein
VKERDQVKQEGSRAGRKGKKEEWNPRRAVHEKRAGVLLPCPPALLEMLPPSADR